MTSDARVTVMSLPPAWVLVESSRARVYRSMATGAASSGTSWEDCLSAAWAMDRSILAFLASSASRTETVVKPAMGTMTVTVSVSTLPKDR